MKRLDPTTERRFPLGLMLGFYGVMSAVSVGVAVGLQGRNPWTVPGTTPSPLAAQVGAGLLAGGAVVAASQILDRTTSWSRRLTKNFRDTLGPLRRRDVAAIAVCSGVGEELLFRGVLMPWIGVTGSSIVFGLVHVGPDRSWAPWTVMAIAMGFAFAGLARSTGTLTAAVVAHATINGVNLFLMQRER